MYCAQKNFFKFLIISLIALCQFRAFGQLEYESLFEKSQFDKINLLTTSILELNRFANIINTFQRKIEISGHTDNVGDDANNLVLSEKRAESVRNYLISIGCSSELLISKGYGESKPVHSNDTDNNRAKNRRVEFKFID